MEKIEEQSSAYSDADMDEGFIEACEKLVLFGGLAGFSMDDMLTLLLNGLSVEQLLDIIGQGIAVCD